MTRISKVLAAAAAIACSLVAVATLSAQTASFSYNDGSGAPNAGTYTPGSSFTFSITLAFTPGGNVANLDGLSYWFEQQNPNAPFNFAITLRDATGSQFNSLQTANVSYPQSMTPSNTSDLGAFLPGPTGVGAGSYFIANLSFSISASAAPGVYVIENTTVGGKRSVLSDDQGHILSIPQATYTITVVPEPASLMLVGLGLSIFGGLSYRRRAKTS